MAKWKYTGKKHFKRYPRSRNPIAVMKAQREQEEPESKRLERKVRRSRGQLGA